MKLTDKLLKNVSIDNTSIEYKRANILIIISLVTIIFMIVLTLKDVLQMHFEGVAIPIIIVIVAIGTLLIIKKGKIILAGNVLATFILVIEIFSMLFNTKNAAIPYYLMGQYYAYFVILLATAMFASRILLVINTFAVIVSTTYIYFATKEQIPAEIKDIAAYGFFIFEFIIVMNTVFSYIFTDFINKAISGMAEKSEQIIRHNKNISNILRSVKLSANELAQASNQQSTISQQITQSANEQASATEELSSSMEQMLAAIHSNTEKAKITGKISSESAEQMETTKEMILKTLNSTEEITERTSIISLIADKTDVLSVNAAIEAAKAGDAGKGFDVVAQEIRKLADKTMIASSEIDKLLKSNNSISEITSKQVNIVIPEISKSAKLVNEIVVASKEQQLSASAVNTAIQKLSEITSENSASAEQMSASADEVSAQAEQLKKIVASYNVTDKLENLE